MDQRPHQQSSLQLAYDRLSAQASLQAAFLGTASHELRAPINQIISLHQLILEGLCESPEEERDFLTQANQAIYRVLGNLDLLINLSKLEIGTLAPQVRSVELAPILTEVQQLSQMKCINRQCRLTVSAEEPTRRVETDPQWLQQALMLLVEGAIATNSPQITLKAAPATETTLAIHITWDGPLALWQADLAKPTGTSPESGQASAATELPDLSPPFCRHLVEQITRHLNHGYQVTGDGETTTHCTLTLPIAAPG
jgi:glucokinase